MWVKMCVSFLTHIRTFNVITIIWAPIGDRKKLSLEEINVPDATQLIAGVRFEPHDVQQATQLVDSTMGAIRCLGQKPWNIFQFYQM